MSQIINKEYFEEFLRDYLGSEYVIGTHGINADNLWIKDGDNYVLDERQAFETRKAILDNGLRIQGERMLASTVRFDSVDDYMSDGYYDGGGVIVAYPSTLASQSGNVVHLGMPDESKLVYNRNYDVTSLGEAVLPEYSKDGGTLAPEYILCAYSKDKDNVIVVFNPNHVHFNGDVISDEEFERMRSAAVAKLGEEVNSFFEVKNQGAMHM